MNGSGINLIALLPCPIKVPFEEEFGSFLREIGPERASARSYRLEGNANIESDYYSTIEHVSDLNELPDIIIPNTKNDLFNDG